MKLLNVSSKYDNNIHNQGRKWAYSSSSTKHPVQKTDSIDNCPKKNKTEASSSNTQTKVKVKVTSGNENREFYDNNCGDNWILKKLG